MGENDQHSPSEEGRVMRYRRAIQAAPMVTLLYILKNISPTNMAKY